MQFFYNNNLYNIHFKGSINCNEIKLIYSPKKKNISQEGFDFIEHCWKKAVEKNNNSYDGNLVELVNFKENTIYFDYTKYSYTLATRKPEWQTTNKGDYKSNHLVCSIIIKTADNKFLITSDLQLTDNIQRWKFIGGFMEQEDKTIFDCVKREAEEETKLSKYIDNYNILGIYDTGHSSCICGISEVSLTSDEIINYIRENKKNIKDSHETAIIKAIDFNSRNVQNLLDCPLVNFGSMTTLNLYLLKQFLLDKNL